MDAEQTRARAKHLGVTLTVPKDRDVILASPRENVTDELAQGIRENKDALIRDVLMSDALAYLNQRWVKGADTSALHQAGENLNHYYHRSLDKYRVAVRTYVETGLAEIRRAKGNQRGAA